MRVLYYLAPLATALTIALAANSNSCEHVFPLCFGICIKIWRHPTLYAESCYWPADGHYHDFKDCVNGTCGRYSEERAQEAMIKICNDGTGEPSSKRRSLSIEVELSTSRAHLVTRADSEENDLWGWSCDDNSRKDLFQPQSLPDFVPADANRENLRTPKQEDALLNDGKSIVRASQIFTYGLTGIMGLVLISI